MAVKQPIFGRSMYLDAAVSEGQLVKVTGDNSVSPAAAGADVVVGSALQAGAAGDKVTIELFTKGIVELVSNGAVVAGNEVSSAADGKPKAKAAGEYAFGVALTSGTNAAVTVMVK